MSYIPVGWIATTRVLPRSHRGAVGGGSRDWSRDIMGHMALAHQLSRHIEVFIGIKDKLLNITISQTERIEDQKMMLNQRGDRVFLSARSTFSPVWDLINRCLASLPPALVLSNYPT